MTDRETQTAKHTARQIARQTGRLIERQTDKQNITTDNQTCHRKQVDIHIGGHMNRHTSRQADSCIHTHTGIHLVIY